MKRGSTHDDRDQFVPKHRTQPRGVPIEMPEDITGQYEGEELREYRSRRSTIQRLEKLEEHKDKTIEVFGKMSGQLETLVTLGNKAEDARQKHEAEKLKAEEREKVRKWILGIIAGLAVAIATIVQAVK